MRLRRHLSISLEPQHVVEWWIGFLVIGLTVERHMTLSGLTEWPELAHAGPRPEGGYKLVFVWPDRQTGRSVEV